MAGISMPLFNLIAGTLSAMLNKQINYKRKHFSKISLSRLLEWNAKRMHQTTKFVLNWHEAIAQLNATDQTESCRSNNWQFNIESVRIMFSFSVFFILIFRTLRMRQMLIESLLYLWTWVRVCVCVRHWTCVLCTNGTFIAHIFFVVDTRIRPI